MNFFKSMFAFVLLSLALTASAATITKSHFDGGHNLNQGSRHGSAGTLSELLMALQDADTASTAALALKQNAAGLVAISCNAGLGGAATEALTCTGLLTTDTILSVTQKTKGANSLPLLGWSTVVTNGLTGVWSANPGASSVLLVAVKR